PVSNPRTEGELEKQLERRKQNISKYRHHTSIKNEVEDGNQAMDNLKRSTKKLTQQRLESFSPTNASVVFHKMPPPNPPSPISGNNQNEPRQATRGIAEQFIPQDISRSPPTPLTSLGLTKRRATPSQANSDEDHSADSLRRQRHRHMLKLKRMSEHVSTSRKGKSSAVRVKNPQKWTPFAKQESDSEEELLKPDYDMNIDVNETDDEEELPDQDTYVAKLQKELQKTHGQDVRVLGPEGCKVTKFENQEEPLYGTYYFLNKFNR
ncbi:hypothetical protein BD410DRAFT_810744, partial [Rickenella mellea]